MLTNLLNYIIFRTVLFLEKCMKKKNATLDLSCVDKAFKCYYSEDGRTKTPNYLTFLSPISFLAI